MNKALIDKIIRNHPNQERVKLLEKARQLTGWVVGFQYLDDQGLRDFVRMYEEPKLLNRREKPNLILKRRK